MTSLDEPRHKQVPTSHKKPRIELLFLGLCGAATIGWITLGIVLFH